MLSTTPLKTGIKLQSDTGAILQQWNDRRYLRCTIAGSDSGGGGAGIQADLKTFSALGVWGCTVITAVTSQNTRAVLSSLTVDTHTLTCQMDAVFQDFAISAVKTGMLPDAKTIETVAENLPPRAVSLVVDPVMIATSGKRLASRKVSLPCASGSYPPVPHLSPPRTYRNSVC